MKKVRYMAGMGAAALAPLAAGTVLAAEPAHAAVACTSASKPFNTGTRGNVKAHGWYKFQGGGICVGTVDVSLKFNKTLTKSAFLVVSSTNGAKLWPKKAHRVEGTAGTTVITAFTVKQVFDVNTVEVCASSTYTGDICEGIGR